MTPRLDREHVEAAFGADARFLGGGTYGDTWLIAGRAEKILCGAPVEPERLVREVEGLQRVHHDRVVRLHDVREVVIDGTVYGTMGFDYIEGPNMQVALATGGPIAVSDARPLLVGLLEGAEAMHDQRVVHRDIKPANVILRGGRWDDPVMCDLGLVRLDDLSSITIYPAQVGTVAYMAPEQLAHQRARSGADLWAIGVMVREALAGRHPFFVPGDSITLRRLEDGPIALPVGVDVDVADVLAHLTAFKRHGRGTARSNLKRLEST